MLLCECKTWATTKYLRSHLDAFATWALHKIFRIPYTRHVSNVKSEEPLVVHRFLTWWLIYVCSSSATLLTIHVMTIMTELSQWLSKYRKDHDQALAVAIQVPPNWKRPKGRPSHTWLHAIEADLGHRTSLASRLPGAKPLSGMTGGTLWTQQCSRGVCY